MFLNSDVLGAIFCKYMHKSLRDKIVQNIFEILTVFNPISKPNKNWPFCQSICLSNPEITSSAIYLVALILLFELL